jgi:hypothetical protein
VFEYLDAPRPQLVMANIYRAGNLAMQRFDIFYRLAQQSLGSTATTNMARHHTEYFVTLYPTRVVNRHRRYFLGRLEQLAAPWRNLLNTESMNSYLWRQADLALVMIDTLNETALPAIRLDTTILTLPDKAGPSSVGD